VLADFGVEVGLEEYRRAWIATGTGPEYAQRTYGLTITADEIKTRKAEVYLELVHRGVTACRGAAEALARLHQTHLLGLATNTARAEVELILRQLGVTRFFHATTAREDYARAKPAPDAYLAAAAALALAPRECAVAEDTARGLRAALAAGMVGIAVPNELTFDNDFTGAARRLASLDELTPALLAEL
jgi:HAD superfamily hydrolase (TIGR01509 family)